MLVELELSEREEPAAVDQPAVVKVAVVPREPIVPPESAAAAAVEAVVDTLGTAVAVVESWPQYLQEVAVLLTPAAN